MEFFKQLVREWLVRHPEVGTDPTPGFLTEEETAFILWHVDAWMDYALEKFGGPAGLAKAIQEYGQRFGTCKRHWQLQQLLAEVLVLSVLKEKGR